MYIKDPTENLWKIQRDKYNSGNCIECGKPRDTKKQRCAVCRRKAIDANNRYFTERNANGKCGLCNLGAAEVYEKKKICLVCWFKQTSYRATKTTANWIAIRKLFYDQDCKCAYTGEILTPGVNASLDHIVPRCRGGSDEISNLQWVTRTQNIKKNKLSDEDYTTALENEKENYQEEKHRKKIQTTGHRNSTRMVTIKIRTEDYDSLYEAWQDSGQTWSDFIIGLLPFYKMRNAPTSARRNKNRRR